MPQCHPAIVHSSTIPLEHLTSHTYKHIPFMFIVHPFRHRRRCTSRYCVNASLLLQRTRRHRYRIRPLIAPRCSGTTHLRPSITRSCWWSTGGSSNSPTRSNYSSRRRHRIIRNTAHTLTRSVAWVTRIIKTLCSRIELCSTYRATTTTLRCQSTSTAPCRHLNFNSFKKTTTNSALRKTPTGK